MARALYYIEHFHKGEWRRTWWTCHPHAAKPAPCGKQKAEERLMRALSTFPHELFRMVKA